MYLNIFSIKLIEENLITKAIEFKLKFYFNIFKKFNLNYNEFKKLILFIYKHYYLNESNLKIIEDMKPIFDKLNKNIILPSRIYRGLIFDKNSKNLKKIINDLENKKISSRKKVLSWSIELKIAKLFATYYQRMLENEIGILINLSKVNYEKYFLFSLYLFFKTDKEFQEFLQFVYDAVYVLDSKLIKKIKLKDQSIYYKGHKVLMGMSYLKFEKEILTTEIKLNSLNKQDLSFQIFEKNKKIKTLSYNDFLNFFKNYLN